MGSEEDILSWERDVLDSKRDNSWMGLILLGPMLCMMLEAETCQLQVDLQTKTVEAVCNLAICIPYQHGNLSGSWPMQMYPFSFDWEKMEETKTMSQLSYTLFV